MKKTDRAESPASRNPAAPDIGRGGVELTRTQVVRLAVDFGAARFGGALSEAEEALCERCGHAPLPRKLDSEAILAKLVRGEDVLGEKLLAAASDYHRSRNGMFYTPIQYVDAMLRWVARSKPTRIVDVGSGTGRFLLKALAEFSSASLVAVDIDPVATLITRARLATAGCRRAKVLNANYLDLNLQPVDGITAFIGNPPYVRHQELTRRLKQTAYSVASELGLSVSGLAGLHAHFLIATAAKASANDIGCFIMSSEWMQSDYGGVIRNLLVGRLGLQTLHLLDPRATAFPGTGTTAVIFGFKVGSKKKTVEVTLHKTPYTFGHRNGNTAEVRRSRFTESRWNFILGSRMRAETHDEPGKIRFGDICAVHRGIATGQNDFFVLTAEESRERGLNPWVRPVLTGASQVSEAKGVVRFSKTMKMLLCAPKDVDFSDASCLALRDYLRWGKSNGVHNRKLCTLRDPWWYLGQPRSACILVTYMGHRSPAFALNPDGLLTLNVIHGLYPRVPLSSAQLSALVQYFNASSNSFLDYGRVYHSGLTKFEPHDLEEIKISPIPRVLRGLALSQAGR